jgi:DMSO reductase family type II enzyme heme b subunit
MDFSLVLSKRVANLADFPNPADPSWRGIPGTSVEMIPAPLGLQPNGYIIASWTDRPYGELELVDVASVHDGERLAVRLSWKKLRPDSGSGEGFPDSAALAFPVRGKPELMQMGSPDAPIHALHWQARKNAIRSVLASGIGSSRTGPDVGETITAGWSQGAWSIVFTRTLAAGGDGAKLVPGEGSQIGFAVWDGGNQERAGIKAVSADWLEFVVET